MRKPYACLIAAVLLSAPEARADEGIFDDRFYAAPMGTFALVRDSRGTGGGVGGTLAAGFGFFPHLGMEVLGSNLHYNAHTLPASGIDAAAALDNVTSYGYGLNLYLSHTNRGLFAHFDGMGNKTLAYDGGLGSRRRRCSTWACSFPSARCRSRRPSRRCRRRRWCRPRRLRRLCLRPQAEPAVGVAGGVRRGGYGSRARRGFSA